MQATQKTRIGVLVVISVVLLSWHATASAAETILLWRHQANFEETNANLAAIERFHQSQNQWRVRVEQLPQASYTQAITASALAGRLPCILEVDQPIAPNFAWSGHIRPLSPLVGSDLVDSVLPTARGLYRGKVYSLGQFDAAVAIYARRSLLEALNARTPTISEPWSVEEFTHLLKQAKSLPRITYPLDMATGEGQSWWTYAFSPILQSYGGDLIDRSTMISAEGILNGPRAIAFATWFQTLFQQELVEARPPDRKSFTLGRSAFALNGNWVLDEYRAAWGDDLLVLPPVDFGAGPVIGGGSWQWAITTGCKTPGAAAELIRFLLSDAEVAAISDATGLIPVTEGGADLSQYYHRGVVCRMSSHSHRKSG
ncbi:MAG: extracellular solute-binding protein, partial [Pseudomonadota bacterium]